MALPNPSINPPDLSRLERTTPPPRSPSASPTRRTARRKHDIAQDPLLRDLSPTKTLQAFTASGTSIAESALVKSLEHASEVDKAFGIRAARACRDLREWATELESWQWPDTFEAPPKPERQEVFMGSLPAEIVTAHQARIEAIQKDLAALDVESLKEHIRSVHAIPDLQPEVSSSPRTPARSMNDFTALTTATILQALPYLSWLNRLMSEWTARLAVCQQVPSFLRGLAHTHNQLENAWHSLHLDQQSSKQAAADVRQHVQDTQAALGSRISALGQKLDGILDELEGRADTIPDAWIDKFEALEGAYSDWVVQAQRVTTSLHWEYDLETSEAEPLTPSVNNDALPAASVMAEAGSTSETPKLPSISAASISRMESPTLGHRPLEIRDRDWSVTTIGAESGINASAQNGPADSTPQKPDEYTLGPLFPRIPQKSPPLLRPIHTGAMSPPPALGSPSTPLSASSIAARKARFNGDLENKQTLTKTQSPVRSFEHASTAFTKLFRSASARAESKSSPKASSSPFGNLRQKISHSRTASKDKQVSAQVVRTPADALPFRDPVRADSLPGATSAAVGSRDASQRPKTATAIPPSFDNDKFGSDKMAIGEPQMISAAEYRWVLGKTDRFDSPMTSTQAGQQWGQQPVFYPIATDELKHHSRIMSVGAFENSFVDSLPDREEPFHTNLASFEDYVRQLRAPMEVHVPHMSAVVHTSAKRPIDRLKLEEISSSGQGRHRRNLSDEVSSQRSFDFDAISRFSTPELKTAATFDLGSPSAAHAPQRKALPTTSSGLGVSSALSSPGNAPTPRKAVFDYDSDADRSASDHEGVLRTPRKSGRKTASVVAYSSPSSVAPTGIADESPRTTNVNRPQLVMIPPPSRNRSETSISDPVWPMPPTYKSPNRPTGNGIKASPTPAQGASVDAPQQSPTKPLPQVPSPTKVPPVVPASASKEKKAPMRKPVQHSFFETTSDSSSDGDFMDKKVSKVLGNLNSDIRFSAKDLRRSPRSKKKPTRGKTEAEAKRDSGHTISPVDTPSAQPHSTDSETRLYHLKQPGRSKPIKLYVRLVGVYQRVMVRVGGGWMDLEEFLRQYAEHHTHRTISGGKVELTEAARVPSAEKRRNTPSPIPYAVGRVEPPMGQLSVSKERLPLQHSDSVRTYYTAPTEQAPVTPGLNDTRGLPSQGSSNTATPGRRSDEQKASPASMSPFPSTAKTAYNSLQGAGGPAKTPPTVAVRSNSFASSKSPMGRSSGTSPFTLYSMSANRRHPSAQTAGPPPSANNGMDDQKAQWVAMMLSRAQAGTSAETNSRRVNRSTPGRAHSRATIKHDGRF